MSSSSSIPLWKRPAPHKLPKLPQIDPSRDMQLSSYFLKMKTPKQGFGVVETHNVILRMVVLQEIEKNVDMWNTKNPLRQQKLYPQVAVEVYKRTGILLHPKSIQGVFKTTRDNLRNRLRTAISAKGLSPEALEDQLWQWNYYGFIRFYRACTQKWEMELRKDLANTWRKSIEKNVEEVEMTDQYEDVIWDETSQSSSSTAHPHHDHEFHPEEPFHLDDTTIEPTTFPYDVYPTSPAKPDFGGTSLMSYSMPPTEESQATPSPSMPLSRPPPPQVTNFSQDMNQITYQATRIAQEQPQCIKVLRKALFDTVLAFDDKNYKNIGDIFRDLAERHSK